MVPHTSLILGLSGYLLPGYMVIVVILGAFAARFRQEMVLRGIEREHKHEINVKIAQFRAQLSPTEEHWAKWAAYEEICRLIGARNPVPRPRGRRPKGLLV